MAELVAVEAARVLAGDAAVLAAGAGPQLARHAAPRRTRLLRSFPMPYDLPHTPVALIGAGPIGLETAVRLKQAGVEYLHFEKGQIASTIMWYPPGTTYFSSPERISIAGIPIQSHNQAKTTKEQYIAYLRSVAMAHRLDVRTYEPVTSIERGPGSGFILHTRSNTGDHAYRADRIVFATGDMARPRLLNIAGEDLPHVSHYFDDPHVYYNKKVLIVGGKNSAAEAALRCYHAGAHVTMSYRRAEFDEKRIKYWILPELQGRIRRGEIACHYNTVPRAITPSHVTLRHESGKADAGSDGAGRVREVEADFVLLLTGYLADQTLLEMAGVELKGGRQAPSFDLDTMETDVPGVYVAGTATAGTQERYRVFIENCHIHADRIAAALTDAPPPARPPSFALPES